MANHPNRATLYTVLDCNGEHQVSGLTVAEAAREVMQYDGHQFEIRAAEDGNGFELWTSQFSRNSTGGGRPLVKSVIYSVADDRDAAEAEIYRKVIAHADWWKGYSVMTDEDYAARKAIFDAEMAEEAEGDK